MPTKIEDLIGPRVPLNEQCFRDHKTKAKDPIYKLRRKKSRVKGAFEKMAENFPNSVKDKNQQVNELDPK